MRLIVIRKFTTCLSCALLTFSTVVQSQTIRIDATPGHVSNRFVPTSTLGAGIDRINTAATDKLFTEPVMKQVLSAGWQTVSYRQNTELFVEAWHRNPQGTWSHPSGKGYLVANPNAGDLVRHAAGYSFPHPG